MGQYVLGQVARCCATLICHVSCFHGWLVIHIYTAVDWDKGFTEVLAWPAVSINDPLNGLGIAVYWAAGALGFLQYTMQRLVYYNAGFVQRLIETKFKPLPLDNLR